MSAPVSPEPENDVKLSFWDHLRELRKRLMLAAWGLLVGGLAIGSWVEKITDWLMRPVLAALPAPPTMSMAAKAALTAAAAATGLADGSKAALLQCATSPVVDDGSKLVLAQLAQAPGISPGLKQALTECSAMASTVEPATKLVFTSAIEPMMVYLKVALYGAVFVAAPWILYQVWQFIAPGLYKKERKVVVPFLLSGTLLFYAGAAFCYFLVMPAAFPAMLQFASSAMTPMLSISEQLGLVTAMLLGFGVVFEVPVIIAFLSMIGLVSADFLTKYRRHAIVANTFLAAVITPTGDPLNLALMAVPMCLFFEVGIILARILGKKKPVTAAIAAK